MFKPTIDVVLNGKYGEKFGTTSESFEKDWVDPITNRIIMKKSGVLVQLWCFKSYKFQVLLIRTAGKQNKERKTINESRKQRTHTKARIDLQCEEKQYIESAM